MDGMYILDENKNPIEIDDVLEWGRWIKGPNRRIDRTDISGVDVSTVFLGLDHSFDGGTPVLFETMIFGGEHDQYMDRYTTYDEAVKEHGKACELVRSNLLTLKLK